MKNAGCSGQFQQTVANAITISGVGIHTGQHVTMTIEPAEPNTGFVFKRIDLEGEPTIKADVDNVTETRRSTTLESNGAKVTTIEHLLAAMVGLGVDNALIKIDGPEVPILDGSSKPFVDAIEQSGIKQLDTPRYCYTLKHNIYFTDEENQVEMVAMPADEYRINTLIDFNSKVLGTQHADLKHIEDFKEEIAPCRTFSFFHELEYLLDKNLIKGGDIENAIVVVEKEVSKEQLHKLSQHFKDLPEFEVTSQGYLNNLQLRFPNEPARHKLLDLVGDLALVGFPFKAHIIANRPGHASNVAFAKKIKEHIKKIKLSPDVPAYDPSKPPVADIEKIQEILPHRYPFLLVDKIIHLDDKTVVGIKNVTFNEPFFQGHFPNNSVFPGVLMVEALAQCGGILCISSVAKEGEKYDTYFVKIDNCRFKHKVVPGDTMILKMELNAPIRRGMCEMAGTVYVGDKVAAEGVFTAQIVKQKQ